MNSKRYYWLKLKDDFFTQKEIKKLRRIAGGDTFTIIYLKLQLLSLKNDGKLVFEGVEDDFIDEMSLVLDEDSENVRITILFLEKHGLLEELNNSEFLLPKACASIGSESTSAERVRKHREKNNLLHGNVEMLLGNTVETKCNTEIRDKREENREKREDEDRQDRPETFYQNNIGLITPHVAEAINKWLQDGVEEQLIHRLMQEAVENDARNWKYINTAIKNQFDKNIKTLANYNIAEAERKRKQEEKPQSKFKAPQPTQITNFKQRDYNDDMSQYYSNVKRG